MATRRFAFLVDGSKAFAGVESCAGGNIRAHVSAESSPVDLRPRKAIGAITYEPFTVEVGLDRTEALLSWLSASFEHGPVLKSGEVHAIDDEYRSLGARQFFPGFIREVEIPVCYASSNDVNHISLRIEPQGLRLKAGSGDRLKVIEGEKQWIASNFRANVEGLPSDNVVKVDTLVWKQRRSAVEHRSATPEIRSPANWTIEVPNVRLTIPMSDWEPWFNWGEAFLLGGNSDTARERNGRIDFLAPGQQEILARIDFLGLGPITLDLPTPEAAADQLATFSVEMYCQDMRLSVG